MECTTSGSHLCLRFGCLSLHRGVGQVLVKGRFFPGPPLFSDLEKTAQPADHSHKKQFFTLQFIYSFIISHKVLISPKISKA